MYYNYVAFYKEIIFTFWISIVVVHSLVIRLLLRFILVNVIVIIILLLLLLIIIILVFRIDRASTSDN